MLCEQLRIIQPNLCSHADNPPPRTIHWMKIVCYPINLHLINLSKWSSHVFQIQLDKECVCVCVPVSGKESNSSEPKLVWWEFSICTSSGKSPLCPPWPSETSPLSQPLLHECRFHLLGECAQSPPFSCKCLELASYVKVLYTPSFLSYIRINKNMLRKWPRDYSRTSLSKLISGGRPMLPGTMFLRKSGKGGLLVRKHVIHTCVPFLQRGGDDRDKTWCF